MIKEHWIAGQGVGMDKFAIYDATGEILPERFNTYQQAREHARQCNLGNVQIVWICSSTGHAYPVNPTAVTN